MEDRLTIFYRYGERDDRLWGLCVLVSAAVFAVVIHVDPYSGPSFLSCSPDGCFKIKLIVLFMTLVLGFAAVLSKARCYKGYIEIDDNSVLAPLGESPSHLRRLMTWEIERIRFVWAVPTDPIPHDRLIIEGGGTSLVVSAEGLETRTELLTLWAKLKKVAPASARIEE